MLLQPTLNYGNPCVETEEPWIGRCNYDAAYEILNHIYGNLTVSELPRMIATGDGFSLSFDGAALLNDRSLAPPSTDRATIDRWRSLAGEHN